MLTEEEEEAPSITEFHSTHLLPVGQTARYTCHAGGTPEPTVEWLHNGRPLVRDGTDDQLEAWVERGFLFVRGGRYGVNTVCCMASNSAGTANHSAELLVFDTCDLTLDPNTANRRLSLSEDNRKVTWVEEFQSYPDHPDRFDSQPQVLGREALTGRCYWEVEVGLYLDRPAGSLSFYRVSPGGGGSSDTLTLIHTFWSSFTQEDLLPGVEPRGHARHGGQRDQTPRTGTKRTTQRKSAKSLQSASGLRTRVKVRTEESVDGSGDDQGGTSKHKPPPPPDDPDLQTPPPAAEHHIWTTEPSHSLADGHKQSQQPRAVTHGNETCHRRRRRDNHDTRRNTPAVREGGREAQRGGGRGEGGGRCRH
ncbi:unnamed protein product [Gadus morhua 'NCC']